MPDIFLYTTPDNPRAAPLLEALRQEYDSRYGNFYDKEGAVAEINRYPSEAFMPPSGNFVLLLRGEETIGGGAFKYYNTQTAELKRIWIRRDVRRQGLARKVLAELEKQAFRQGYSRLYLTTGFRQPEAVGLYLNHGYKALFDLDADPESIMHLPFEKELPANILRS